MVFENTDDFDKTKKMMEFWMKIAPIIGIIWLIFLMCAISICLLFIGKYLKVI